MAGINPQAMGANDFRGGREIVRPFAISAVSAAFLSTTHVFGPAAKRYAVVQVGPLRGVAFNTDGTLTSRIIRAAEGESANVSGTSVTGGLTVTSALTANENTPVHSINTDNNILEIGETLYHRITSAVSVSGLAQLIGEVRLFELPN